MGSAINEIVPMTPYFKALCRSLTRYFFFQHLLASSISIIMIYDSNTTRKYQNTKEIVPINPYFKALCRSLTQVFFFSTSSGFLHLHNNDIRLKYHQKISKYK